jgi:hypothetical protein
MSAAINGHKHGELQIIEPLPINRPKLLMFGDNRIAPAKPVDLRSHRKALNPLTFYLTMVEDRPQLEHPMNPFI